LLSFAAKNLSRAYQSAKLFQIINILVQIIRLRRFQATRMHREALIVHNMPETLLPNFPLPNMSVSIDARTQIRFRIVQ